MFSLVFWEMVILAVMKRHFSHILKPAKEEAYSERGDLIIRVCPRSPVFSSLLYHRFLM